jgi:hypothetical protein
MRMLASLALAGLSSACGSEGPHSTAASTGGCEPLQPRRSKGLRQFVVTPFSFLANAGLTARQDSTVGRLVRAWRRDGEGIS